MTLLARHTLTSALVAGLLLGGIGLARGRGGPAGPAGARPDLGGHAAVRGLAVLPMLAGLPIGTSVEVAFFEADPAPGVAPVTTLAITVGTDSEAAFAAAFAEARATAVAWEAAFLVVSTGEVRRTIALPGADAAVTPGRLWGASSLHLPLAGLRAGDTITVELYAADPAAGGALLETRVFAYGIDSAIGFRAAVEEALEGAAVAMVTTSPRSVTVDLKAIPERAADVAARMGAMAERMGRMADRFGAAAGRWGEAPMAPGMRGRR